MANNRNVAAKIAAKVMAQVKRAAGKGIDAVAIFLVSRMKETVNVPSKGPAIPYDPVRKRSGELQRRLFAEKVETDRGIRLGLGSSAKSSQGFPYPKYHEDPVMGALGYAGMHAFVKPTIKQYRPEITVILGKNFSLSWKQELYKR